MHHRWLLVPPFLASGAALAAHILTAFSLHVGLAFLVGIGAAVAWIVYRRATPSQRVDLRRRLSAGLVAGVPATMAYDLIRYLLVEVLRLSFWPFDVFTIFGKLLVGEQLPAPLVTLAGVIYHVSNGIGFAVGYALLLGDRGWKAGLAWALGLEVVMVSLYPGWLDITAFEEFLSVSMLGHVAYGLVLGTISQKILQKRR